MYYFMRRLLVLSCFIWCRSFLPASAECSELSAYFIASLSLSSSASFTFTRVQVLVGGEIFQNSDLMSWSPLDWGNRHPTIDEILNQSSHAIDWGALLLCSDLAVWCRGRPSWGLVVKESIFLRFVNDFGHKNKVNKKLRLHLFQVSKFQRQTHSQRIDRQTDIFAFLCTI